MTATPESPVNVVLYLVDTLRADRLGLYGYPRPTSPTLDRLALESVVFENAHAPAPWTLPSVVSLLTSTFPCEHGVLKDGQKLNAELAPMASRFQQLGYATASFHANAYAGPLSGLDRGFDVSELRRPAGPSDVAPWLEGLPEDRPFFLYVHNVEPHDPYRLRDEPTGLDDGVSRKTRHEVNQRMRRYRRLTHAETGEEGELGSPENAAKQRESAEQLAALSNEVSALYDGEIRRADAALARLVDLLKRRGVWEHTLFVFVSDHGEELGDHGAWQHNHAVYEEVVRVPFLMRFPGAEFAGRRIEAPVSLVDLMPTLFDFLGESELGEPSRGRNLMPLVRGGAPPDPDELRVTSMRINEKVFHAPLDARRGNVNVVFRDGRFKGIWNVDRDSTELYDLSSDARERDDLSDSEDGAERARAATAATRAWLESCRARAVDATDGGLGDVDPATLESLRSLGYVQ